MGFCEHGNEHTSRMKHDEFNDQGLSESPHEGPSELHTNFMELYPSRESASCAATKELSNIL
jgi:hypothetical protein